MADFQQLFLYIPGIVIFLVGSGRTRGWIRGLRGTDSADGFGTACEHVVKKDAKDRDVYNFYNVSVEYIDKESHHTVRQSFKSTSEYALSQPVRVVRESSGKTSVTEKVDEEIFHPLTMMVVGAALILLALWQNQGKQELAMAALAATFLISGAALIINYVKLRKKNLTVLEATITDVYKRQISKETKIIRGNRFTYYPVVRYEAGGRECIRRCLINSSGEKTFKIGDTMKLYLEPATGAVREKCARPGVLAAGIVLAALGLVVGLSILSVLL